jgi:hypothetical protein
LSSFLFFFFFFFASYLAAHVAWLVWWLDGRAMGRRAGGGGEEGVLANIDSKMVVAIVAAEEQQQRLRFCIFPSLHFDLHQLLQVSSLSSVWISIFGYLLPFFMTYDASLVAGGRGVRADVEMGRRRKEWRAE